MKLRGLFVFMLAASLAVQPLSADRAWGEMTIAYGNPITGEGSYSAFDEASLAEIDIFTSSENLNIGVQIDNNASITSGGNNGRLEVTLGISDTPTFDSVTADSVTIGDAAAGATIEKTANGLSMGNSVLSGLANGTADADAATVGQMNAANALQDERLNAIDEKNIEQDNRINAADEKNIEQDNRINASDEKNIEQDNRINASDEKNIEQDNRINASDNKNIEQDGRLSAHDTEFRTLQDVLGSGYNNPNFNALTAQSLTMGGHTITATNDGFNMGGARLSGIADGGIYRGSTDAVTGDQLWRAYNRMDDLGERINVVGAHAAALSGLHPIQYNPYEPTTLSAAVGTYRDEYAVAVGVFHYVRENMLFNVGASLCSDGDLMGRAGISIAVGKSTKRKPELARDMVGMQRQMYVMQAKLERLESENKQSEAAEAKLREENAQNRRIIEQNAATLRKNEEIMKKNAELIRELTKKLEAKK